MPRMRAASPFLRPLSVGDGLQETLPRRQGGPGRAVPRPRASPAFLGFFWPGRPRAGRGPLPMRPSGDSRRRIHASCQFPNQPGPVMGGQELQDLRVKAAHGFGGFPLPRLIRGPWPAEGINSRCSLRGEADGRGCPHAVKEVLPEAPRAMRRWWRSLLAPVITLNVHRDGWRP